MTVFVVSQPYSGMVLAKGMFRLIGTCAGALVSIGMVALYGQASLPFLLLMALWLAFCTAGASLLHNHASYGFVLAGYTAAIVALPASADPATVFDQAVARCSEIGLGILCAALVNVLLWPRRLERQLANQGKAAWEAGLQAAAAELRGADERGELLAALGRIAAADAQRDHAWFEGALGRARSQALRVLGLDLLGLLRAARKVARERRLLDPASAHALQPWLEELEALLREGRQAEFEACRQRLRLALDAAHGQLHLCLVCLERLLGEARAAGRSVEALVYGAPTCQAPGAIAWHRDIERGVLFGLRSALAFLCVAAFWLASAWPSGLGAVSITGVVLSLFASRDNPAQAGLNFLRGILLSIPLAGFVVLFYLPGVDGFPLLCLGLGVPLFFAALSCEPGEPGRDRLAVLHLLREERRAEQQHELRPRALPQQRPVDGARGGLRRAGVQPGQPAAGRTPLPAHAAGHPRRPGAAHPALAGAGRGLVRRAHRGSPDPPGAALRPFAGGAPPALVGRPDGTRLRRRAALPAAVPGGGPGVPGAGPRPLPAAPAPGAAGRWPAGRA